MTAKTHHYHTRTEWTGNLGVGTAHYTAYSRDHIHSAPGKADIPGSADPAYRGDPEAEMNEAAGRMTAIRLKPRVTISAASDPALALALHHDAHRDCYIANTLNCPVTIDAHIEQA